MEIRTHSELLQHLTACLEYLDKHHLSMPAIKLAHCLELLTGDDVAPGTALTSDTP
jgi:hypothetical protein